MNLNTPTIPKELQALDIVSPDLKTEDTSIHLPGFELQEQNRLGKIVFLNSLLSSSKIKQPNIHRNSATITLGDSSRHLYFRKMGPSILNKANQIIDRKKLSWLFHNKLYPLCIYAQSKGGLTGLTNIEEYLYEIDPHKLFFAFINNHEKLPSGDYSFPISSNGLMETIKNNLVLLFDRHTIESILKKMRKQENFTRRELLFILSIFKPEEIATAD